MTKRDVVKKLGKMAKDMPYLREVAANAKEYIGKHTVVGNTWFFNGMYENHYGCELEIWAMYDKEGKQFLFSGAHKFPGPEFPAFTKATCEEIESCICEYDRMCIKLSGVQDDATELIKRYKQCLLSDMSLSAVQRLSGEKSELYRESLVYAEPETKIYIIRAGVVGLISRAVEDYSCCISYGGRCINLEGPELYRSEFDYEVFV